MPLLEAHPCEAVHTNVLGTANVVDAAVGGGVERFVFISTDKAVRADQRDGRVEAARRADDARPPARPRRRYCAVRFGNVLGSRGSVIPTFVRQIEPAARSPSPTPG